MGTVNLVGFKFAGRFKHAIPTPFHKVLNMQGPTTPTLVMIKNILDLIITRLISSRMERRYISSGLRTIITNCGLELRCVKNIVNMPLTRQLKMEGHSANSISDPKRPNKLSSQFT